MYVNEAEYNDLKGGTWVQLNQKQYIIKGIVHGMGLHLVVYEVSMSERFHISPLAYINNLIAPLLSKLLDSDLL